MKPEGERGVLFVGGIGLARGYLEEEEKTRHKFIELPGIGRAPLLRNFLSSLHTPRTAAPPASLRSTTPETLLLVPVTAASTTTDEWTGR